MSNPYSVSHVAAPAVCLKTRLIQRCAICGRKLVDTDLHEYKPEDVIQVIEGHPVLAHIGGTVIRYDYQSMDDEDPTMTIIYCGHLPPDHCFPLVEK